MWDALPTTTSAPPLPDGTLIAPTQMAYNWVNYDFTAALTYKLTKNFGFTGDFTYIVQHPTISTFAPATMPNTGRISVPLGRAGIYYNNPWLSLTSLFSYISKTNNNSTLNLQHDGEIKAAPLTYDIQTWGWTTDVVAHPFKGFDFHFLFTYRKPTYKKYETSVKFASGYEGKINATGNIVAEVPQVLIELDPSYMITPELKLGLPSATSPRPTPTSTRPTTSTATGRPSVVSTGRPASA